MHTFRITSSVVVMVATFSVALTAFFLSIDSARAWHLPDETAGHSSPGTPPPSPSSGGGSGSGGGGGTGSGGGGGSGSFTVTFENPLRFNTLTELLSALLDIMLVFAVPIIVFFLILSGFKYVMAQGNPGEIQKATKMFMWTVIGGLIILGAWVLVEVIQGTVEALR